MTYDPAKHHRRSIRLPNYDYGTSAAYSLTCVTHQRECLFGKVVKGKMVLSVLGLIVDECWQAVAIHFESVTLDAFVVMPNHVHGIVVIESGNSGNNDVADAPNVAVQKFPKLGQIVGYFKYQVAKRVNLRRDTTAAPVWQRNYHEHIIRNQREWDALRKYIADNPMQWTLDRENPHR